MTDTYVYFDPTFTAGSNQTWNTIGNGGTYNVYGNFTSNGYISDYFTAGGTGTIYNSESYTLEDIKIKIKTLTGKCIVMAA